MENEIDVSQWHPIGKEYGTPYMDRLIEAVSQSEISFNELLGRYNYLITEWHKQQQAGQEPNHGAE